MNTSTPNSTLNKAFSYAEVYMANQNSSNPLMNAPRPRDHNAAAAGAAATGMNIMMPAMQGPAAAKKRKRPSADGAAAAGSKPGSRRGRGGAMDLKPGLCDFCGVKESRLVSCNEGCWVSMTQQQCCETGCVTAVTSVMCGKFLWEFSTCCC
jgi:hypothetical protein